MPPATPQVVDFAQDVQVGLLGVVPVNDPLDILSVAWSCEDPFAGTPSSNPKLVTKMKVSDLSTLPRPRTGGRISPQRARRGPEPDRRLLLRPFGPRRSVLLPRLD